MNISGKSSTAGLMRLLLFEVTTANEKAQLRILMSALGLIRLSFVSFLMAVASRRWLPGFSKSVGTFILGAVQETSHRNLCFPSRVVISTL